jgi:hypothetical protein
MADKFQFKRGTASGWTAGNPVLAAGEPGYELDTKKMKVGDGITAWNSLPCMYLAVDPGAPPIGFHYTQYASVADDDPEVAFPEAEEPETLWPGTTWVKLWDTESVYFRTEGTDADDGRVDGKQLDQMQGHWHSYDSGTTAAPGNYIQANPTARVTNETAIKSPSSDGVNGTPRTGSETRVTNRLMRIWKRTA